MSLDPFCTCLCNPSMMRTCINCSYQMLVLERQNLCKIALASTNINYSLSFHRICN
uniref:Uncharacterized protein n=1 Tax=Rhizophora mucronata TaxID=61149 RepID=A0A2P2MVZ1_RHIMU